MQSTGSSSTALHIRRSQSIDLSGLEELVEGEMSEVVYTERVVLTGQWVGVMALDQIDVGGEDLETLEELSSVTEGQRESEDVVKE